MLQIPCCVLTGASSSAAAATAHLSAEDAEGLFGDDEDSDEDLDGLEAQLRETEVT